MIGFWSRTIQELLLYARHPPRKHDPRKDSPTIRLKHLHFRVINSELRSITIARLRSSPLAAITDYPPSRIDTQSSTPQSQNRNSNTDLPSLPWALFSTPWSRSNCTNHEVGMVLRTAGDARYAHRNRFRRTSKIQLKRHTSCLEAVLPAKAWSSHSLRGCRRMSKRK